MNGANARPFNTRIACHVRASGRVNVVGWHRRLCFLFCFLLFCFRDDSALKGAQRGVALGFSLQKCARLFRCS